MEKEEIGKLIYMARINKGLTLQELAKDIGVTPASISRWENGEKHILGENLIKLIQRLDLIDDFFGDKNKESQENKSHPVQKTINKLSDRLSRIEQRLGMV